ncbi:26S proteasome regulatory subunit rpn1 [Trichophyton interdigitale]|uniref:26S proteasome regulatory subunit rpn1 n=1 Tax=Trichophyton interdigitale TaxID=101480 RepID=A0A9P5CYM3_9EURO|nr:26S proteasome regulatory subunit rpn1 [Trichophyton interdigitale]KAF3894889.1 26S proteasome regulatory subunit rpn1 [Trichophyton interdigitale]KAG8208561.1 26S proteasome regulatory subunit rpn1 [Trichophyton interdigitale]
MSSSKHLFLSDEELGKKYDDHNRRDSIYGLSLGSFWRRLPRRRRIALVFFVAFVVFIFCKHIPTRVGYVGQRSQILDDSWLHSSHETSVGLEPDEIDSTPDEKGIKYYRRPIEFESLFESLYSTRDLNNYANQESVIFATGQLKSLGDMLPIACDMAARKRNSVHLAIMGRDEIPLADIQRANGFREEDCPVTWHDARPIHASTSSPWRLELSVKAALVHMYRILAPRAFITRDIELEEAFFIDAIEIRAFQLGVTHISLPSSLSNFKWIADLDAYSLEAWNDVQTEILINVLPNSSGAFRKLLRSLQEADYFGPAPGLTIELPVDADPTLLYFLKNFRWPPKTAHRQFTLRRRISPSVLSSQEAAVRTVDSFYPKNPNFSHVILVSPDTELAPSFFHFLKYSLLKYKYGDSEDLPGHLLGVSLELPSSRPTDGKPFSVPMSISSPNPSKGRPAEIPTLLWQIPDNNAVLYFGDMWAEFQSFLSHRLSPSIQRRGKDVHKVILKSYPSWMDYMLEFMRARGYYLVYPAFAAQDDLAIATVHNELHRPPEEYDDPNQIQVKSKFEEKDLAHSPSTLSTLLDVYPGMLPDIRELSVLPYTGELTHDDESTNEQDSFLQTFRKEVGGCTNSDEKPESVPLKADDLFCIEEEPISKEGVEIPA